MQLIHSTSVTTPYPFGTSTGGAASSAGATDAFGRIRTSSPLTLFDSSHRYRDNGLWSTSTATGGTWVSAGTNSSVEYNITGTSTAGGRILAQGYFSASTQSSPTIDILKEALFKFQLERDGLTSTPFELSLVMTGSTTTCSVHASMDWEEISR